MNYEESSSLCDLDLGVIIIIYLLQIVRRNYQLLEILTFIMEVGNRIQV